MVEFFAFFGFLGGVLACYQLSTLGRHRALRNLNGRIAQLREELRAIEAKLERPDG